MGQNLSMRLLRGLCQLSAVAVVLLGAFGCGADSDTTGGMPRPKYTRSVVSLSPSTSEIMGAIGGYEYLKGRTQSCNYPSVISSARVVADVKPDYDAIAEIHPDVIVLDQSLYNEQDMQKIRQAKSEPFIINANTLDGFEDQLLMFGRLIQKESDYSKYVDKIVQAVATAKAAAISPAPKVAVVMPDAGHSHMISGNASFLADVLKQCGLQPVGPSGEVFVPLNVEFLISQNPDVIVTSGDAAPLLNDPRLAALNAVKKRQVISILSDVLLRRGSRVDKLVEGISKGVASIYAKKAS